MSITFHPEMVTTGRVFISVLSEEAGWEYVPVSDYTSYAEAEADFFNVVAANPSADRWDFSIVVETLDAPSVNMSNGNAVDLLLALDLPTDEYCGSEEGETFLARVLFALAAERLDDARPTFSETSEGGATMIHGGRSAGYVTERLTQLLSVAQHAADTGLAVNWG